MACGKCKKRSSDNGKVKSGSVKKNKLSQTEIDEIKKQLESMGIK